MIKTMCMSWKVYIEADINDDVDLTGEWAEDKLQCEVMDNIEATFKETTGKVKIERIDFTPHESEIVEFKMKGKKDEEENKNIVL